MQMLEPRRGLFAGREPLARSLPDAVMSPNDPDGFFELLVPARDPDDALVRVWSAISAEGEQERFTVVDVDRS